MNRSGWVIPVLLIVVILVLVGLHTISRFRTAAQPAAPADSPAQAVAPPPAPAYEHPTLIPELAGIRLGMREERVAAILGVPPGKVPTTDGAVLKYNGLNVTMSRGQVSVIRVTGGGWRSPAGFEVGQTYEKLWGCYRTPDLSYVNQDGQDGSAGEWIRLYFSYDLEFGVSQKNDTITAMWVRPSRPGPFASSGLIVDSSIERPVLRRYGREYVIVVSQAIRDAIDKYDPSFTTWRYDNYDPECRREYVFTEREGLFCVVGDFNGDKLWDLVLDGYTSGSNVTLSVVSGKAGYRAVEVNKRPKSAPAKDFRAQYLLLAGPGLMSSEWEEEAISLTTDAFKQCAYGKSETLYYLKDDTWQPFVAGD